MSASVEIGALGDHLHRILRKRVDTATYNLWLSDVKITELPDGSLQLALPAHTQRWIQARFGDTIATCASEALGRQVHLQPADADHLCADRDDACRRGNSTLTGDGFSASATSAAASPQSPAGRCASASASGLLTSQRPNPTLTFGRFVIGESNRLAHSAALTAAELPGSAYNPLLIYGSSGCGKTHLLHAIAAVSTFGGQHLNVLLTSGEAFTASFLCALQRRATVEFKASVRNVDALLIDDVSFIAGKRRTEDELLHAFNTITERGGQVIFTFDRAPESVGWTSSCLRERLRSGLAVEVNPPDQRLREVIVRRTLQEHGIEPGGDVLVERLVSGVTDSLRSLQSALMRSLAYASLRGEELSVDAVDCVLKAFYGECSVPVRSGSAPIADSLPRARKPRTIAEIQTLTASHFHVDHKGLVSRSRSRSLVWPRQVAMYLARVHLNASLQSIGSAFDNRDHATVIHACKRVQHRIATDRIAREQVESVLDMSAGTRAHSQPIDPRAST